MFEEETLFIKRVGFNLVETLFIIIFIIINILFLICKVKVTSAILDFDLSGLNSRIQYQV